MRPNTAHLTCNLGAERREPAIGHSQNIGAISGYRVAFVAQSFGSRAHRPAEKMLHTYLSHSVSLS